MNHIDSNQCFKLHSYTNVAHIKGNKRFNVLPRNTSLCDCILPGTKPPTILLENNFSNITEFCLIVLYISYLLLDSDFLSYSKHRRNKFKYVQIGVIYVVALQLCHGSWFVPHSGIDIYPNDNNTLLSEKRKHTPAGKMFYTLIKHCFHIPVH